MRVNNVFVSNIKEMRVTVDVKSEENEPSMPLADVIEAFETAKREFDRALYVLRTHQRSVEAARKRAEAHKSWQQATEAAARRQMFTPQSWEEARVKLERDLGLSRGPDAYRDAGNALPTGSIFETRAAPAVSANNKTVEVGREAKDAGWYKPESMADAYARLTSADFDTSDKAMDEYECAEAAKSGKLPLDARNGCVMVKRGMVVKLSGGDSPHFALPLGKPLVVVDISKDRTMAALDDGATVRWVPLDGRIRLWQ